MLSTFSTATASTTATTTRRFIIVKLLSKRFKATATAPALAATPVTTKAEEQSKAFPHRTFKKPQHIIKTPPLLIVKTPPPPPPSPANSSHANTTMVEIPAAGEEKGAATYRSKHYVPLPGEVKEFITSTRLSWQKGPTSLEHFVKCPSCFVKATKKEHSLRVNLISGRFACYSCGVEGGWGQFLQLLDEPSPSSAISSSAQLSSSTVIAEEKMQEFSGQLNNYLKTLQTHPHLREFLKKQGLKEQVWRDYLVGAHHDASTKKTYLVFTKTVLDEEAKPKPTQFKLAAWENHGISVKHAAWEPALPRPAGLFGYHVATGSSVILTGTELDALAAYQATGIPSFSLPLHANQLPLHVMPLLERFDLIYLWMENSLIGRNSASKFAHKLGLGRCRIVTLPDAALNGPLDALKQGLDLRSFIQTAQPLGHQQIVGFKDLKSVVFMELSHPEQVRGIPSADFPRLNQIIKGHRPGELTIFSGTTGIGKTTVLSQLSLDYCARGVSTLWGSFEISNVRLARKMLCQFSGKNLEQVEAKEREEWGKKFESLPLYFMRFYGSTQVDAVLEAMQHAHYSYDIQHVVIDNLQFMTSGLGHGFERWEIQDDALALFRRFATEHQVHVTLVVHPRKDDRDTLEMNSVFGSAKVTQEADNVIILQRGRGYNYFDIKKNRFDGTVGIVPFKFNQDSLKAAELGNEEWQLLLKKSPSSFKSSSPTSSNSWRK